MLSSICVLHHLRPTSSVHLTIYISYHLCPEPHVPYTTYTCGLPTCEAHLSAAWCIKLQHIALHCITSHHIASIAAHCIAVHCSTAQVNNNDQFLATEAAPLPHHAPSHATSAAGCTLSSSLLSGLSRSSTPCLSPPLHPSPSLPYAHITFDCTGLHHFLLTLSYA